MFKSRGALSARDRSFQTWILLWEVSHQVLQEMDESWKWWPPIREYSRLWVGTQTRPWETSQNRFKTKSQQMWINVDCLWDSRDLRISVFLRRIPGVAGFGWVKGKWLSHVRLSATPLTLAYQVPPSMGFSRQEYWSGLPFPSSEDVPDAGIKPRSPTLKADALLNRPLGKSQGLGTKFLKTL